MNRLPPVWRYEKEAVYDCRSCLNRWIQMSGLTKCPVCESIDVVWRNHPLTFEYRRTQNES